MHMASVIERNGISN